MQINDPEILTLITEARGPDAGAEARAALDAIERRLARPGSPERSPGGKAGWTAQIRTWLRQRAEAAALCQAIEAHETGDRTDETIDQAAIDREAIRRLLVHGEPHLAGQLLGTMRLIANRARAGADQCAARIATATAWSRAGNGGFDELLALFRREVLARRECEQRAEQLTAAADRIRATLEASLPEAIGDVAALRTDLREASLLARGGDQELAGLEAELSAVDAKLGRLGHARAAAAKAARSIGLGRVGSELIEQREALASRVQAREKELLGSAIDQAAGIVVGAAGGDPDAVAELLETVERQPRAFDPSLPGRIREALSTAFAGEAGAILGILD